MKRLLRLSLPVVWMLLYGCQSEEIIINTPVQFTIDVPQTGLRVDNSMPSTIHATLLQIGNDSEGTTQRGMTFTKRNDRYVSEMTNVARGHYQILIDKTNEFDAVDPVEVEITGHDGNVRIAAQGLRAKGSHPFQLAIFGRDGDRVKPIDAVVNIYGNNEFYEFALGAKTNHIAFRGNPAATYTIEVRKDGYEPYISTFVYNAITRKRIEITLQKKSTQFVPAVPIHPTSGFFSVWIHVMQSGTLTLDWGNGETEVLNFNVDPLDETGTAYFYRDREYTTAIPTIKLTGNVELIKGLLFEGGIDAITTQYAPALSELNLTNAILETLDLSVNVNLQVLSFSNSTIRQLILPQQHQINYFAVTPSATWPTAEQLDYIISNIHSNTVAANIVGGTIELNGATVSAQSAEMLAELQTTYGWTISE